MAIFSEAIRILKTDLNSVLSLLGKNDTGTGISAKYVCKRF